jgi:hypothetical protein
MTEYLSELEAEAESGGPDAVARYDKAKAMWQERRRLMVEQEKADYARELKNIVDSGGLSENQINSTIENLSSGAATKITAQLYQTALAQRKAYLTARKNLPVYKAQCDAFKRAVFVALADPLREGKVTLPGGKEVDLNDEKQRNALALSYEILPEDIMKINKEASSSAAKAAWDIADTIAGIANKMTGKKVFNAYNVAMTMPFLMSEGLSVMNTLAPDSTKTEGYKDQIRAHLVEVMARMTAEERRFLFFDKDVSLVDFVAEGLDENGNVIRDKEGKIKDFDAWIKLGLPHEAVESINASRNRVNAWANNKSLKGSDITPEYVPGFRPLPKGGQK